MTEDRPRRRRDTDDATSSESGTPGLAVPGPQPMPPPESAPEQERPERPEPRESDR